jgi:hypothetical protein
MKRDLIVLGSKLCPDVKSEKVCCTAVQCLWDKLQRTDMSVCCSQPSSGCVLSVLTMVSVILQSREIRSLNAMMDTKLSNILSLG